MLNLINIKMAFLRDDKIASLKFKSIGKNVLISEFASFYNSTNIEIGDNVRIDDFCILSAGEDGIKIGNYVHISCYVSLIGKGLIEVGDFSNISSRTAIYSSNDDYSGNFLAGPIIPDELTNVTHGKVSIGKHVIIGVNCVILPHVTIHEGVAVGAFSLVKKDVEPFTIVGGNPLNILKKRELNVIELEEEFKKFFLES